MSRPLGGYAAGGRRAVPATTRIGRERTRSRPQSVVSIAVTTTDPVRVVRIDQPDVRNAIDSATAARLHDEFVAFDADPDQRVAVLTGDEPGVLLGRQPQGPARRCDRAVRSARPDSSCRSRSSPPSRAGAWPAAWSWRPGATCGWPATTARFGFLERRWGVPLIDGGTYRHAPHRRAGPGARPHPHRPRVRRHRGRGDRVRQPGGARRARRWPPRWSWPSALATGAVAGAGQRPAVGLRGPRARARRERWPTRTGGGGTRSSPRASSTAWPSSSSGRGRPGPPSSRLGLTAAAAGGGGPGCR